LIARKISLDCGLDRKTRKPLLLDLSGVISAQIAFVKLIENPKQASHDPYDEEQCCCMHFCSFVKLTGLNYRKISS
jgi:hypothetical protein